MDYLDVISRIAGNDCVTEFKSVPMVGKLDASQEHGDYAVLVVPQSFADSVYDAIYQKGMQKPEDGAHISVMDDKEMAKIGKGKVVEDGQEFPFTVESVESVRPFQWEEMERVWFVKCKSPKLEELRKNYDLPPLMHDGHDFHITIAVKPSVKPKK